MRKIYLFTVLFLVTAQFTSMVAQTTDYIQVVLYGQSLGLGWQSPRAITTVALDNNYMTGNNVNTLYSTGNTTLNPLVAAKWKSGGEQPIVSCVNAYSEAYRTKNNTNQKFIAVSAGEGGRTIERLSKECTNNGYYDSTFIESLDNTLAAINGETVSCPAIIYMQGEYNAVANAARDQGLTPGTNGTQDKNEYKALLLTLKNNMQADIMSKYGQTEKPLFFIYQTSGGYVRIKELPIVMAQIEFSEENSDVVLLNPHYAMPDYTNGHLSTNGYRWFGELMSKSLIKELVDSTSAETLKPTNFNIDGKTITIDYNVPVLPMVLDTWTTPMQSNYGFVVYENSSEVVINSVQIINDNQVEITCDTDLVSGVEIVYAGSTVNGSGNLRDSDSTTSMYTYFDDSSDSLQESYTPTTQNGGSIYGESYGLQNWSNMFYYKNGTIGDTFTIGDYNYKVTSTSPDEVEVTGADTVPVAISIPRTVINEGITYDVKSVGYYAFYQKGGFAAPTSIVLAEGITSIAETGFNNLLNVTTVTFPSTLTDIGFRAFRQCEKIVNLNFPAGLTAIGEQAFQANYKLETVNIPVGVTSLGDSAFRYCTSLTNVTVESATPPTLNTNAFRDVTVSGINLHIPNGSLAAYTASDWSGFNIIETTLSSNNVTKDNDFSVFPSPTSGIVSVSGLENIIDITVLSVKGSVLLKTKEAQFDISNLTSAVYFVKVKTIDNEFFKRIIRE